MLHTDETAKKQAEKIIEQKGIKGTIVECFWVKNEEQGESQDMFCYSIKYEDGHISIPSWDAPLFLRNGEMTDFTFPVYA